MPKGNMVALNTPLRRQRKSTACVFYCDKTTLICGSLLSPMSPSWSRVFLWKSSMHSTTWDGRESPGGCDDWNATWQLEKNCRWDVCKLHCPDCGVRWIFAMNVNANTPCHFTRGLDHGCKAFEFTNIARSMRSRTLAAIFASSRKRISLYWLPCICLNSRTLFGVCTPESL